jgi:hypothetical protein
MLGVVIVLGVLIGVPNGVRFAARRWPRATWLALVACCAAICALGAYVLAGVTGAVDPRDPMAVDGVARVIGPAIGASVMAIGGCGLVVLAAVARRSTQRARLGRLAGPVARPRVTTARLVRDRA